MSDPSRDGGRQKMLVVAITTLLLLLFYACLGLPYRLPRLASLRPTLGATDILKLKPTNHTQDALSLSLAADILKLEPTNHTQDALSLAPDILKLKPTNHTQDALSLAADILKLKSAKMTAQDPSLTRALRIRTKQILRLRKKNCGCRRVLLVIIFNFKHYDNVPFLHAMYGSVFCNIVHYGLESDELFEVRQSRDPSHGVYQQTTIVQAWRDFPDFDGYMWAGDDALLNTQRLFGELRGLDVRNIWVQGYSDEQLVDLDKLPQTWAWGHPFNGTTTSDDLVRDWKEKTPAMFRLRQRIVFGGNHMLGVSSDVGYIPAEFMKDLAVMADLFPTLNFEIFIPTVARLLSNDTQRVQGLSGLYLWGKRDRQAWARRYHTDVHDFVHPVKLSSDTSRSAVFEKLNLSWSPAAGKC